MFVLYAWLGRDCTIHIHGAVNLIIMVYPETWECVCHFKAVPFRIFTFEVKKVAWTGTRPSLLSGNHLGVAK